ncbi:MAG TPA: phosphomethylpyrimidine synthase ThiC, partial [Spirochaetota bacterium]|nr:phosphomethylpyrimidine synthase ThiC [Spirochaetota bacterium]
MNIFEKARKGEIPHEIAQVAQSEGLSADYILQNFISGEIVIMKNSLRSIAPLAVGKGLKTKVNANIGTSPDLFDLDTELSKLTAAIEAGADAVMDLSTGGDIAMFRNRILEQSPLALGTVPLYEVAVDMIQKKQSLMDMTIDDFLKVIRRQAEDGVDFMTIHSGVTRESIRSLHSQKRIIGITSRGGSIIAEWMLINKKENPLYEHYDEILDILRQYNVVISLGDGIRPGALNDASESPSQRLIQML